LRGPNRHGHLLVGFGMEDMPLHFSPTRRLQQTAVGGGRLASHLCRPNWLGPQSIDARASSEPVPRSRSHLTRCMAKGVAQSRVADSALPILPSGIGSPTRPSPSHSRLALEERVLTSTRGDAGTACAAGRSKLDTRPGAGVLSIHQAPMRSIPQTMSPSRRLLSTITSLLPTPSPKALRHRLEPGVALLSLFCWGSSRGWLRPERRGDELAAVGFNDCQALPAQGREETEFLCASPTTIQGKTSITEVTSNSPSRGGPRKTLLQGAFHSDPVPVCCGRPLWGRGCA
jgi:hypothetical protein